MAPPGKGTRKPAALEPVPVNPEPVPVDPPITLGQFLKVAQFASSGGEAKHLIAVGSVRVNGQVEPRRGRKLVPGEVVEVGGTTAVVAPTSSDTRVGTRS